MQVSKDWKSRKEQCIELQTPCREKRAQIESDQSLHNQSNVDTVQGTGDIWMHIEEDRERNSRRNIMNINRSMRSIKRSQK